jgi:hypothetical protein
MRSPSRLLSLLALLLTFVSQSGFDCTGQPTAVTFNPEIESGLVTTFSFPISVTVQAGAYQAGTLQFTLNGQPLALAGGPLAFSTTMNPGAPLLDANLLAVSGLAANGVTVTTQRAFQYAPPKAKLRQITNPADLMSGPIAHGRVGDYLLENTVARFIVQDVQKRDLHSVGEYGGNLIDAELVGVPGKENFFEVQPSVNVETVINAQTVQILNDGQNGLPAQLRTCGPDDTMDYVNASAVAAQVGATFPPIADDIDYPVEGCTVFTLEPLKAHVKLDTTITNLDTVTRGFYVGDYINGMGELEQWTNPMGIGEVNVATMEGMSYNGFGEAEGVQYGFSGIPVTGSSFPGYTFFTTSGVSFVMAGNSIPLVLFLGFPPNFTIPASSSRTYTRYFGVGDGSSRNLIDMMNDVNGVTKGTLSGCVTAGGAPAPGARVSIGAASSGALTTVVSTWIADASGCYSGSVPVGSYQAVAAKQGFPYEPGGTLPTLPLLHPVTITNGGSTVQNFALPATGQLHVTVVDEASAPVPARVSIVGFDPSPEPVIVIPGGFGLPAANNGTFNDVSKDGIPYGLSRVVYSSAGGVVDLDLEPGTYQIYVTRGTEYSAYSAPLTMTAGATTNVNAQIARVLDTSGFISSDYHVHAINSPDSRINYNRRIQSFGGENVENLILTEHDAHYDLSSQIASTGFAPFLHTTVGEEITTFDYGHFNSYPRTVDPTRPSGGSTDHGDAAPPGQDFVQYGNYSLSPAQIYAAATTDATSTPDTVVQINHIDSHFSPLRINTSLVPPQSVLTPTQQLALRQNPAIPNLFHHFPALELWNGAGRGDQGQFLNQRIGVWFNHLNQGLETTMIGDTDTHELFNVNTGGSRTWTSSTTDAPAAISDTEMANAVKAGRAVAGQGIYVQTRLLAQDGSGNVADFMQGGSTLVASSNGSVDLEIDIQAPAWAEYDRIEIYANAATTVFASNGGVPVLFGATPTLVLDKGVDFTVTTSTPHPSVPSAQRQETTKTVSFPGLAQDTWFVVVVKGRDGVSKPMFPVFPQNLSATGNTTLADLLDGNLGQNGTMALGNTNALYADVDGTAGFKGPLEP